MINPTGNKIRMDSMGSGIYGSSRGRGRAHKGVDYLCEPGQEVLMPITGKITRVAKPYRDGDLSGIKIQSKTMAMTMFYFAPNLELIGMRVQAGSVIGVAQDVSLRYDKHRMFPHIHLQIDSINPDVFISDFEV